MSIDNNPTPLKEIVLRAWTDPAFKERLKSDPRSTFSEFGIKFGENKRKILVVENNDKEVYFVLPDRPDLAKLNDDQIRELIDSVLGAQLVLPTIL